jgi:lambda repressor-like predicted transcriptional regulator
MSNNISIIIQQPFSVFDRNLLTFEALLHLTWPLHVARSGLIHLNGVDITKTSKAHGIPYSTLYTAAHGIKPCKNGRTILSDILNIPEDTLYPEANHG